MSKQTNNQVIILSGELSDLSLEENMHRSIRLGRMIKDLEMPFKSVLGCYKGKRESSFMVVIKNIDEIETLKSFAFLNFNQESILYQDSNGLCYLEYRDGTCERIGKFEEVKASECENFDAYTKVDDKVYIIK